MVPLTPWVKRLLIANVAVHFLLYGQPLYMAMVFDPGAVMTAPWTVITYQFLHGGFGHLFFNMFALFVFGPRIEQRVGGRSFMVLYLGSGVAGAALTLFLQPSPMVGASGAVFGVMMAYAVLWPTTVFHIWGIFPVQAWALAMIMVVTSLWMGFTNTGAGIAHFAHLGGLAYGYSYLKWWDWRKGAAKREFERKLDLTNHPVQTGQASPPPGPTVGEDALIRQWESIDTSKLHELNREEVETVLRKAREAGVRALTRDERQFMERMVRA